MISAAVSRRAAELAAARAAFVNATVVRARRPTSAHAGDAAIVLSDGTIEGFVGGSCAEHSVRVYALAAIESGEPLLLRIVPFDGVAAASSPEEAAEEVSREEGVVTVQNPCLSGGSIEVFLEPVLPAPRVLVVGDTPIAAAVRELGAQLGLDIVAVADGDESAAVDDADAVGHFLGHAQLMSRDEHGHARARAFLQNIFHNARVLRVEADHRLVYHEHLRVVQQRGYDGDALACAVRKAFERAVHKFGEVKA